MKRVEVKCPYCYSYTSINIERSEASCLECGHFIKREKAIEATIEFAKTFSKKDIAISIRVKDDTLKKLLLIGESHFKTYNYEYAKNAFGQAIEIDKQNWFAIYRYGICKTLNLYWTKKTVEINHIETCTKRACKILNETHQEIELEMCIKETEKIITNFVNEACDFYTSQRLRFGKNDANAVISKCISILIYLNSISKSNETKLILTNSIISSIDHLLEKKKYNGFSLGEPAVLYTKLPADIKQQWLSTKQKYIEQKTLIDPEFAYREETRKIMKKVESSNTKKRLLFFIGTIIYFYLSWLFLPIYIVSSIIFFIGGISFNSSLYNKFNKQKIVKYTILFIRLSFIFIGLIVYYIFRK